MIGADPQQVFFGSHDDDADERLQGAATDTRVTIPKFRAGFKWFVENFSLSGSFVYKEQIRALGGVDAVDALAIPDGAVPAAPTTLSLPLDLEHLNMRNWVTADGGISQTIPDDDGMSQTDDGGAEGHGRAFADAILYAIRRHPLKYLPVAEEVAKEVYATLHPGVAKERVPPIQIELFSRARPTKIRHLKATDVESLVVLPGIVIQCGRPGQKATKLKIRCRDCKAERILKLPPWRQGVDLPRVCEAPKGPEEAKCSLDPYAVLADESEYCDVQTLKFQELPEDVPTGDMPRHLMLNAANSLCGRMAPGERVNVVGVFSAYDRQGGDQKTKGEAVRTSYLHVLGIEQRDGSSNRKVSRWGYQDEEEFRKMSQDPDLYSKIAKSIAPAIYGFDDVKKSIACLLFGGTRKSMADRTRLRGDINLLLLGDPSTAKSQFLKFVERAAPIAIYTSGKGSSAAGLTAAIIKDSGGNFALEGGAMVLADGGVVCIDEFDKMRDDDRVAIHEAMEQQTISIAKAGITTVLNTMCSVLAAANPTFGSYDDTKETTEQHDFETTILSRFDLIWLVRDEKSLQRDVTIAQHVYSLHAGQGGVMAAEGPIPVEVLRQYIKYCREACDPRLSPAAAKKLENYYVEVREGCRGDVRKQRDQIPITVRQLESLARLAESLAKMALCREVAVEHVEEAIRLFQLATVEASKSALARENLTPVEREHIKAAEDVVLQRLPINARASKATILRDLVIRGYDPGHVGRALRVLVQRGVLQERGDASVKRLQ